MLRFGVLGAGRIGNVHAKALRDSGRAQVAYVADAMPEAAGRAGRESGRQDRLGRGRHHSEGRSTRY